MYGLPLQQRDLIVDRLKRIGCSRVFGLRVSRVARAIMKSADWGLSFKRRRAPALLSALPNPGTEPFVMMQIVVHC